MFIDDGDRRRRAYYIPFCNLFESYNFFPNSLLFRTFLERKKKVLLFRTPNVIKDFAMCEFK